MNLKCDILVSKFAFKWVNLCRYSSVPALDGTQLSWTGSGDVAMASFRLPKEEPISVTLRRTKHPLRNAFRTIDAADYSEISHVEVERSLVDSCWVWLRTADISLTHNKLTLG